MTGFPGTARAAMFLLLCGVPAACANAEPGAPLDRSKLKLSFSEDFQKPPSFYDAKLAPNGRWKTNFWFSIQQTDAPKGWEARTLRPNQELEYYGDPLAGTNPFDWKPGSLTIVADHNPRQSDPLTGGLPYLSGVITTEKSFSQLYGYFEARITMPVGPGLWPAFWLLPVPKVTADGVRSPGQREIDIVENIGHADEIWLTVHQDVGNRKGDGQKLTGVTIDRPHTYGLLLTQSDIVWYIDDKEVRRRANLDFHDPAYMLINLAVGGYWPGPPDATTRFPAAMHIAWVRAYELQP